MGKGSRVGGLNCGVRVGVGEERWLGRGVLWRVWHGVLFVASEGVATRGTIER